MVCRSIGEKKVGKKFSRIKFVSEKFSHLKEFLSLSPD